MFTDKFSGDKFSGDTRCGAPPGYTFLYESQHSAHSQSVTLPIYECRVGLIVLNPRLSSIDLSYLQSTHQNGSNPGLIHVGVAVLLPLPYHDLRHC